MPWRPAPVVVPPTGLASLIVTNSVTNGTGDVLGPTATIAGGTVTAGAVLFLQMKGSLVGSTPPIFRWQLMIDGVSRLAITTTPSGAGPGWVHEATLTFRAAGVAAATIAFAEVRLGQPGGAQGNSQLAESAEAATTNIDTTASHTYDLRANMQTAVAGNTLTVTTGVIAWSKL